MKITTILLTISSILLSSCDSSKDRVHEAVTQMMSEYIDIPYDKMECWTNDSLMKVSPWKQAKLKLVHFVDSTQCSSCYLHKIAIQEKLLHFEHDYKKVFTNVFIIAPGQRDRRKLYAEYGSDLLPATIFVDTTHVFVESNPKFPEESMLHTFLLDENNKVILVGNPYVNKNMYEFLVGKVEERLRKIK